MTPVLFHSIHSPLHSISPQIKIYSLSLGLWLSCCDSWKLPQRTAWSTTWQVIEDDFYFTIQLHCPNFPPSHKFYWRHTSSDSLQMFCSFPTLDHHICVSHWWRTFFPPLLTWLTPFYTFFINCYFLHKTSSEFFSWDNQDKLSLYKRPNIAVIELNTQYFDVLLIWQFSLPDYTFVRAGRFLFLVH